MRAVFAIFLVLASCEASRNRQLDPQLVDVSSDARLRTDTVGDGKFAARATFVLVDAENHGKTGAYITLAGELADAAGKRVGSLRAQSLWIPPGESRTFALVDHDQKARPTATAATIRVKGAMIPAAPPPAHVGERRELEDNGHVVAQGIVHNDGARAGTITVIASFHDAEGQPITRPFSLVRVPAHATQPVQFVGPPGATHGTIYVGEMVY